MNSLRLLLDCSPDWVSVRHHNILEAQIAVAPPPVGGGSATSYELVLRQSERRGVIVSETTPGAILPEFCLERHINSDGTFCLYYESDLPLQDLQVAQDWWRALAAFFDCQTYAQKHGVWHLNSGLSHGDAANHQLAMEELAEPLGWIQDVLLGMFRQKGWLAGRLPRVTRELDRVLNARAPCPRGCTWKHGVLRRKSCEIKECDASCRRNHKPIVRKSCPKRSSVEKLILLEIKRRRAEAKIITKMRNDGKQCCGTMEHCPLRK